MQYVFILGRNAELSVAEIQAVVPGARTVAQSRLFLVVTTNDYLDAPAVLGRLGGTIKIGRIISERIDPKAIVASLEKEAPSGKLRFGISFYDCAATNLGLEVKKSLKQLSINSRLVTSRDKALSSVVVAKNKCIEFLVLQNKWLAKTEAVQAFEDYSRRDYGRPVRDMKSGTLPPKLAKIMINLAQVPTSATILDPFCGSGTMIQEALLLGYANIIASDQSAKAVGDTKANLAWLGKELGIRNPAFAKASAGEQESGINFKTVKIFQCDVRDLTKSISKVDAIITEPYLGPPLRGIESDYQIGRVIQELTTLYVEAFTMFSKILKPGGVVVIILPWFHQHNRTIEITKPLERLGFTQRNRSTLIYSRPDQKVWRQIFVFSFK